MKQSDIDDRIYDLYDEYCHGKIDRRQFFDVVKSCHRFIVDADE